MSKSGESADGLFPEMQKLLGLRAYARHRAERGLPGGHHRAVEVAIRNGRIPTHEVNGEIFVDPAEADEAWESTTQLQLGRTDGGGSSYADERAATQRIERETKELRLAQLKGELVSAEQVRREAFETGRVVRERLMGLPARLASQLRAAALTGASDRAIEELLSAEIHEALRALSREER